MEFLGDFQNEVQHFVRDWNDGLFYDGDRVGRFGTVSRAGAQAEAALCAGRSPLDIGTKMPKNF